MYIFSKPKQELVNDYYFFTNQSRKTFDQALRNRQYFYSRMCKGSHHSPKDLHGSTACRKEECRDFRKANGRQKPCDHMSLLSCTTSPTDPSVNPSGMKGTAVKRRWSDIWTESKHSDEESQFLAKLTLSAVSSVGKWLPYHGVHKEDCCNLCIQICCFFVYDRETLKKLWLLLSQNNCQGSKAGTCL